jgi:hypothetical protein
MALDMAHYSEPKQLALDMAHCSELKQMALDMADCSELKQMALDMADCSEPKQLAQYMAHCSELKQMALDMAHCSEKKQMALDVAHCSEPKQMALEMAQCSETQLSLSSSLNIFHMEECFELAFCFFKVYISTYVQVLFFVITIFVTKPERKLRFGLDSRQILVRIPTGLRDLTLLQSIPTSSGVIQPPYSIGIGESLPTGKGIEAKI